jgi:single-strand DNA-binding protein
MLNRVTLIGNLGKDPEIRRLENGAVVAKFSLATNEYYRDKTDQLQQVTEWHDIVCWRALAEQAERILKKGRLVYIEGKLAHREYTTQDGQKRYITEILASTLKVLDREKREDGSFPSEEQPMARNTNVNAGSPSMPSDDSVMGGSDIPPPTAEPGDDLPF